MENVSPTLILLWDVRRALEKGQSVGTGIKSFLARKGNDEFFAEVHRWNLARENPLQLFDKSHLVSSRRYLLSILEIGLQGQSILELLKSYETELIESCEDEIQAHLARLPLLLMFPLMGLIFPALMLVLVGPLLRGFQF